MVGLEAGLLGSAALAFTLFLWLVLYGRDHTRADFAAHADAHGWDHRSGAPGHLTRSLVQFAHGEREGDELGPYFAGPSGAGPFQVAAISRPRNERKIKQGAWTGDRTFVHIRTATSSPGLRFGPRGVFEPRTHGAAIEDAVGHERFLRRYEVEANDPDFVAKALDYEACKLLIKPDRGVACVWDDHDLMFLFPVRPSTMAGYETLLRFAVAATRRLERHDGRNMSVPRAPTPSPSPAPQAGASAA